MDTYVTGDTDLDGRLRIVGGTVDVGAYEYQGPGMSEFIGWLDEHALPTDGSADYTDSDNDRMNNWQEWHCGTVPTNGASLLRLLTPGTNASGLTVSWESVPNRSYFLERGTNLNAGYSMTDAGFSIVATNIPGQFGTTSYTDTNAVGSRLLYYRVGIQDP